MAAYAQNTRGVAYSVLPNVVGVGGCVCVPRVCSCVRALFVVALKRLLNYLGKPLGLCRGLRGPKCEKVKKAFANQSGSLRNRFGGKIHALC